MSANLDYSRGQAAFLNITKDGAPAWHGAGLNVIGARTAEEALKQAQLDFIVTKMPNIHMIPAGNEFIEIVSEDSFFTYREDVNKVLGSKLGKDYTVLQNQEVFSIVDDLLQTGNFTIETAGALNEGKKVFVCLKVNKSIIVNGKDETKQFLLICNSHDGSQAIMAMFTNVRVVCSNTLAAALGEAQDKIRIRHTLNAKSRLDEAMRILKAIEENTAINTENYNRMAEIEISKNEMFDYFGNLFLDKKQIAALQGGANFRDTAIVSKVKQNQLAEVLRFANTGRGQADTLKNGNPTMWTAYNAVTGFASREKYKDADQRANSMLFGSGYALIHDAGELALCPAKVQPLHKVNGLSNLNFN